MLDAATLEVKIKAELEFQARAQTRSHQDAPSPHLSEPVQTEAEPVRTRSEAFEQRQSGTDLAALRAENEILKFDKATRDAKIEFLSEQNSEWQQALLGQSRYIGHLETKLMRLGGEADQTFLAVPMAERPVEPEIVNPDQPDLGVG